MTLDRPMVSRLEMHVTHACNLACESCSHFSDHGHLGHLALEQADAWMQRWRQRIAVETFVLLGGEPTIHPDLADFVYLVRAHWPQAKIVIITNGFLLNRHPGLPQALAACGRTELFLSVHHASAQYLARIEPILQLVKDWSSQYGISVSVTPSYQYWTRRYLGFGSQMMPFQDGDAGKSWQICPAKHCRQLFDGMLWKCSPIAYLRLQNSKFTLARDWDPYLSYRPLPPDCEDDAIRDFLARGAEEICSMCPATKREFQLPDPLARRQRSTDRISVDA